MIHNQRKEGKSNRIFSVFNILYAKQWIKKRIGWLSNGLVFVLFPWQTFKVKMETLTLPLTWPVTVVYHRPASLACFGFGLTCRCRVRLFPLQSHQHHAQSATSAPAGTNNTARKSFLFLGMGRTKAWLSAFSVKNERWFKLHHTAGTCVGSDISETAFQRSWICDLVYWCVDGSS